MLDFTKTDHGLILKPQKSAIELFEAHLASDNTDQATYRLYDQLSEHYDIHNNQSWIMLTADQIVGNLSEAPILIERKAASLQDTHEPNRYLLMHGDFYYFADYMIHCFVERMSLENQVYFNRA